MRRQPNETQRQMQIVSRRPPQAGKAGLQIVQAALDVFRDFQSHKEAIFSRLAVLLICLRHSRLPPTGMTFVVFMPAEYGIAMTRASKVGEGNRAIE